MKNGVALVSDVPPFLSDGLVAGDHCVNRADGGAITGLPTKRSIGTSQWR
jgi:hypothetical protein